MVRCWRVSGIKIVEERVGGHRGLEGARLSHPLAWLGTHTADHLHVPRCLNTGLYWPLTLSPWGLEHLHLRWPFGRPLPPLPLLCRLLILHTLKSSAFAGLRNSRKGMWFRVDLVGVHEAWATVAGVWPWALSALLSVTGGRFLGHLSLCRPFLLCFGCTTGLSCLLTRWISMLLPRYACLLTALSSQLHGFGFTVCLSYLDPLRSSRNKFGMHELGWSCVTRLKLKALTLLCAWTVSHHCSLSVGLTLGWFGLLVIPRSLLWISSCYTCIFSLGLISLPERCIGNLIGAVLDNRIRVPICNLWGFHWLFGVCAISWILTGVCHAVPLLVSI